MAEFTSVETKAVVIICEVPNSNLEAVYYSPEAVIEPHGDSVEITPVEAGWSLSYREKAVPGAGTRNG